MITRWLSMKYVAVRVLDQLKNLKQYFLKFLLQEKNFRSIAKTDRYKRIENGLKDPLLEAYLGFVAFTANIYERFLLPFQSAEPKIHILYPSMCRLISELMSKFLRKRALSTNDSDNLLIDIHKQENLKPVKCIEIGTKAKRVLGTFSDLPGTESETKKGFLKSCLAFYMKSTGYLLDHLPLNSSVLKNCRFLNPERRNESGALNGISNLCMKVAGAVEQNL